MALLALLAGYFFSRKVREDREVQGLGALGALGGLFIFSREVAKIAKYRALALLALLAGYFFSRKYREDCYTGMQ
jgi:hypothetical protein